MKRILLLLVAVAGFSAYKFGLPESIKNTAPVQVIQEASSLDQRRQRINSIVGCSADAGRQKCRCYDRHGSTEIVLNREQCLAVVDRGLAALKDF